MDVNNTQYCLLRNEQEFAHSSPHFTWDARRSALVLSQAQQLRLPNPEPAEALSVWQASGPLVQDPFGQIGRIAPSGEVVQYNSGNGFFTLQDGELKDVRAPRGSFVDLAIGGDGRLVAAYTNGADEHGVLVFQLARRWQTYAPLPEAPVCAIVDEDNRIWCATVGHLTLFEGEPLPHPYRPLSDRFEPMDVNPHPLRLIGQRALPAGLHPLALCADAERIHLLVYDDVFTQQILVRPRDEVVDRAFDAYVLADDVPFVTDLAVVPDGRLAAITAREPGDAQFTRRDCAVLRLAWDEEKHSGEAHLIRERYPMLSQAAPRFVGSLDAQVRYQAEADPENLKFTPRPRELHPLLRPRYPTVAHATLRRELDSGQPDTVWHRLYLEACIPPGSKLDVYAKAYNESGRGGRMPFIKQPQPLWSPLRSELPFHEGLVESRPRESGLFEVLLQCGTGSVRRLAGRYLQLHIRMEGDGQCTPAVHAIRVYYPRFSYQEAYLPEHVRQEETCKPGVPANGADVRERFLATLEGMLTPIEGKVAAAEALIHPDAAPNDNLSWLAGMLGLNVPEYWPEDRRRRSIKQGCLLQQWRGTYGGVRKALDIATDHAVRRGEIVIVENFRLRRTMATILGVDMDDRDHPLTLGTGMSGNSIVGDSLILSEEDARTFLSLFAPELATESEKAAIKAFFDRYSHQVSVLLHGPVRQQRSLVESVLREHMPTHVRWKIIETDHPFVLGLAPLLAVDTYVEITPPPRRVTLDRTYLGREGVLRNPLALSPRDVNARPAES